MNKKDLVDAVIVAAGQSTRFGGDKLFADLCGYPVIVRTIDAIAKAPSIQQIIIVGAAEELEKLETLCKKSQSKKPKIFVEGGNRRRDSVEAGIGLTRTEYVAIHDGARPLVETSLIETCIEEARGRMGALLASPINDSIKRISGKNVIENLEREELRAAQTPQVVRKIDWIKSAKINTSDVSDDIAMLDKLDGEIHVIEGDLENIKITRPIDLILARTIWEQRASS